jgi:hypothetical protein
MSAGDTDSIFATCQRFALRYSDLRVETGRLLANPSRSPESLAQIHQLAKRIQTLDAQIAYWLESIPDEFRFKTVCWVSEDDIGVLNRGGGYGEVEVFPGRVDIYPDFVTAMAWNIARVTRLLLVSITVRIDAWLCSPADYRTTAEYEASWRHCQDIIPDILASVPYHLGWHMNGKTLGRPGLSAFACGEDGTHKALPSLFLIWSLTCVKNFDLSTDEQRAWARGRLRFIAEEIGLKYAHIVNEVSSFLCRSKQQQASALTTFQFHLRFPSMMIRQDGMMATRDPLHPGASGFTLKTKAVPQTPESPASIHIPPSSSPLSRTWSAS